MHFDTNSETTIILTISCDYGFQLALLTKLLRMWEMLIVCTLIVVVRKFICKEETISLMAIMLITTTVVIIIIGRAGNRRFGHILRVLNVLAIYMLSLLYCLMSQHSPLSRCPQALCVHITQCMYSCLCYNHI